MTSPRLQEMSITLVALFNEGRYAEAERVALEITKLFPQSAFGWKGLGTVIKSQGRAAQSLEPMRKAVALSPEDAEAHINLGNILKDLGHLEDSAACYRQALKIKPDYAQAHFRLGNLLADMGRLHEAEASYRQALAIQPDYAEAFNNQGNVLKTLGHLNSAEASYRQALAIQPAYPEAHINLGNILKDLGEFDQAVECYRMALWLKPDYAEAYNNLGIACKNLGRMDEAEANYRQALKIRPNFSEAYYNLGIALCDQGRLDEAENSFRRALKIKPDYAEAYSHLGVILEELGQLDEAEASYRQALEIQPDYAEVHSNRGNVLKNLGRLDEAEASYRQALVIAPTLAEVHYNLGLLMLAMGRYAEAWPRCEYRYHPQKRLKTIKIPDLPYPQWKGESLLGKSLLIWPEQGFGDYLQLVRYVTLLKDRGLSRITLACPLPLKALLSTIVGVDAVITQFGGANPVPHHDYWSLLLSLPRYFDTELSTIPARLPYLHAEPCRVDQWRDRLPTTGLRVGLVWKGAPGHKNDNNRSLPELATLAPLWSVPGVTFISLQKGRGEDDPWLLSKVRPVTNLGPDLKDFADTAAVVAQLDLVICVDTAIAHLAGALGKSCWVLLPALYPDWRWLLDRSDSPWYPGVVRLFRQTVHGDWGAVIEQLVQALEGWTTDILLAKKS